LPLTADILVAEPLSDHERHTLAQEFQTIGLTPELREVPPRRSLGDIAWLVLAAVPLKPFFDQLAKDFATDAYKRLQMLAARVFRQDRPQPQPGEPPRVLLLQDSATGIQIVLEPDLPEQAYQQLLAFDLAALRRGPLHYDRHRRQWRSELDEAEPASPPG
jgi:hypothetical protein